MSIKINKSSGETQHVEKPLKTSLSFLMLDEVEIVQPCSPPIHEDKETIIFSHVDGFMKEPLDMVDEHIDWQTQVGFRSSHFL